MSVPGSLESLVERLAGINKDGLGWLNRVFTEPPEALDPSDLPALVIAVTGTASMEARADTLRAGWIVQSTYYLRPFPAGGLTNAPLTGIWSHVDDVNRLLFQNRLEKDGVPLRGLIQWTPTQNSGYRLLPYPEIEGSPVFVTIRDVHLAVIDRVLRR